jgi:hypothetical protein
MRILGAIVAVTTLQLGDLRVRGARLWYRFEHAVHGCCELYCPTPRAAIVVLLRIGCSGSGYIRGLEIILVIIKAAGKRCKSETRLDRDFHLTD